MRSNGRLALPGLVIPLLSTLSCGGETPSSSTTVEDSAGVHIVSVPVGAVATSHAEAVLQLGQDGQPDYEFFRVRGVQALGSGNVVVANAGTSELRFYSPSGEFIRAVGGPGDGPSEFRSLFRMWVREGDTITAQDSRRRRLAHFDSAGAYVRGEDYGEDLEFSPSGCPGFFPSLWGKLHQGPGILSGTECLNFQGGDGVRRTSAELYLLDDDGRSPLGTFEVQSIWERASAASPREAYDLVPFGPVRLIAFGAQTVYVSEARRPEISGFDAEGRLITLLREGREPVPVTDAHREAYRAEREAAEWPLDPAVPFPVAFPAYDQLLVSYDGDVWARHGAAPDSEIRTWVVFPSDRSEPWYVQTPDVRVWAVRDGRAYATATDDLDIESVVGFEVGR